MPNNNDDVDDFSSMNVIVERAGIGNDNGDHEKTKHIDDESDLDTDDNCDLAIVVSTTEIAHDNGPDDNSRGDTNADEKPANGGNSIDEQTSSRTRSSSCFQETSSCFQQTDPDLITEPRRTSFRNQKQDEFVKHGARVKALINNALCAVSDGTMHTALDSCDNQNNINDFRTDHLEKVRHTNADYERVQFLAQERSEECLALKRVRTISFCIYVRRYLLIIFLIMF